MDTLFLIFILSMVVWLCPPFRNYTTKYFYFFVVLALADPAIIFLNQLFKLHPVRINVLTGLLIVISLINLKRDWRIVVIIIFSLAFFIISMTVPFDKLWAITILLFFMAMLILIKDFIIDIMSTEQWNLFYIIMILYIFSIIIKIIYLIHYEETGMAYFVTTSAFQILIGLYFSFYNVNNSRKIGVFAGSRN